VVSEWVVLRYYYCLFSEIILELREFLVFLVFGVCLFVLCLSFVVRRQCWATCPTVLTMGVSQTSVAFMYKKETMHRFDGSLSSSTGNYCLFW
jgi:hypothetical protein